MKIIYKDKTVTGINRDPQPDEAVIEVKREQLIWGLRPEYYSVVAGHLVAVDKAEKDAMDKADDLTRDKEEKIAAIKAAWVESEKTATIELNGTTWRADRDFLLQVDLERRLAEANGETEITIIDVDLNPHIVRFAAVDSVMQLIRQRTSLGYLAMQHRIRLVKLATAVDEVAAV